MRKPKPIDALRGLACVLGLCLILGPVAAMAAGDSSDDRSDPPSTMSTAYRTAKQAIDQKRYAVAVPILEKVVQDEPRNAGAYNYLAFANRKLGRLDVAYRLYRKALAIDPGHRGAHEYLGELYLQRGDLANAEAMLGKLNGLCFFGCEEYDDLKKAIAAYKTQHGKRS